MRKKFLTCICALAISHSFPAHGSEPEIVYHVSGTHLTCLFTNSPNYLALEDDLLIIAVARCPDIPADPLLSVTSNANPSLPKAGNTLDQLLVLEKDELLCLRDLGSISPSATYYVFPERCAIDLVN